MTESGREYDLSVALLHENMHNKKGELVTTSVTLIDVHDIARSSRTYGVTTTYIAHPSPTLRKLNQTLKHHWEEGYGSTYNPNRKDALTRIEIVEHLEDAIKHIENRTGERPKLIATSARKGPDRVTFKAMQEKLYAESPHLLLFGTGWGMSEELLALTDYFLEPVDGAGDYNHLSVRSACAIILDRLLGR